MTKRKIHIRSKLMWSEVRVVW